MSTIPSSLDLPPDEQRSLQPLCKDSNCGYCGLLERIKQEWEDTVDNLPQIISLLDAEGRIVRLNRTVERWGLGRVNDVLGLPLHDLLHPNCGTPDCDLRDFLEHARDITPQGTEAHYQTWDLILGRFIDIQMRPHTYRANTLSDSQSDFVVAVVTDISEIKTVEHALQKSAEELQHKVHERTLELAQANHQLLKEAFELQQAQDALSRSRDEYKRLVETMGEGLAVQDKDGRLTYINQRLANMLGYAMDDMIGRPLQDFIGEELRVKSSSHHGQPPDADLETYETHLKGSRSPLWVKVSPRAIQDHNGNYDGFFAVITDISDRVRTEQELRQLSIEVLSVQEDERQRIASELHDGIGQTLSAIKFFVENTVRKLQPDNDASKLLDIVPRLQAAIEEIQRISMNLRPLMLDELGILPTLSWFCRGYQANYPDIDVILRIDVEESDVPASLKASIFRIVQEAMHNVAKHSGSDRVRITLRKNGQELALDIKDWGRGFNSDELARKRGQFQSGSGLINMRKRAKNDGGRFRLESTPGTGVGIYIVWSDFGSQSDWGAPVSGSEPG